MHSGAPLLGASSPLESRRESRSGARRSYAVKDGWPRKILIVVALASCDRTLPSPSPEPQSPSVEAVDPPDAAVPDAPADAPEIVTDAQPAAKAPTVTLAEREEIVGGLCGAAPVKSSRGAWACACPSYTELGRDPDGGQLEAVSFFRGAFSKAGRDEVVVDLAGCETGASSSLTYGGHALLRRAPVGWTRLSYEPGALGECTAVVSADGQSRLVCRTPSGNMGPYRNELSLLAYAEAPAGAKEHREEILSFSSQTTDPSVNGAGFTGPLRILEAKRFEVLGRERYAAGDDRALSIEIDVESRVACVGPATACAGVVLGAELHPLRFGFDGARFAIEPASRQALARLRERDADR